MGQTTSAPATTTTAAAAVATPAYALQTTWSGSNFFNGFTFFTDPDPTHGFVNYVDQQTATNMGLIAARDGAATYVGVDYKNKYNGSAPFYGINGVGRPSVRLTSKASYTKGLFIIDLANMPGGVCGVWPAFWTLGPNWPTSGEIDIIESISLNTASSSALHTAAQCDVPGGNSSQTGNTISTNCNWENGGNYAGCQVVANDNKSVGKAFNSNKGGVFALDWTDSWIRIYNWPSSSVPADITSGKPTPSTWGKPYADFTGNCNIASNFKNNQLVLDTTFCGDWAGSVWANQCQAATGYASCSNYVGDNPAVFQDQFWSINSLKIYQLSTPAAPSTTTSSRVPTTTSSTTTSSRVSTTPSATPTSALSPYKYLGCYTDSSDRTLSSSDSTSTNSMTLALCRNFCYSRGGGYKYFGVENGNQCFCGNTLRSSGVSRPQSECSTACAGDSTSKCGAGWRLSIYSQ